jgi:hypothetical protein
LDPVNEPQESRRTREGYGFKSRKKALRGEPQGHFKHGTRLEESKNHERQDGNQTMKVFLDKRGIACLFKVL